MAESGLAHAKVNLFLEVLGRREDGFHELASVFQELELADALSLEPSAAREDELLLSGRPLDGDPRENLVMRAVRACREHHPELPAMRIRLEKRIPSGAGLGGGSSDAAMTLRLLQQHLGRTALPDEVLAAKARNLGSDVPFFLTGGTALCTGRGERVQRLSPRSSHWFVLAVPPYELSTAAVYAELSLKSARQEVMSFVRTLEGRPGEGVIRCFNRLESSAFALEPRLPALRTALEQGSAVSWTLTGSGSVLFSIVGTEHEARRVASTVTRLDDVQVLVTRSHAR